MRHLLSLIAGVVIAPLAWALVALGQTASAETMAKWAEAAEFNTSDLIPAAAYLVGAGLIVGLIATLRVSPLGALIAGLAYVGLNVGLFIDPFAVRDAVPDDLKIADEPIALRTPLLNGTLLVLGTLLVVAAFSAKRWRQWPTEAAAVTEPAVPDESGEPGAPTTLEWSTTPADPETTEGAEPAAPRHAAMGEPVTQASPSSPSSPPPTSPFGGTPAATTGTTGNDAPGSPWAAPPRPGERT